MYSLTHTKGYYAGILIYIWNVLSYASSSGLSAIWLLACDSESHTLLIEWVLDYNTDKHSGTHSCIHPPIHTGDFVANGGRVRDGCQA